MSATILGIDLGTTNSSVAVVIDGRPTLLPVQGAALMPSVVGLDPSGQLVIGATARNQHIAFPERTIASIKRRMGDATQLSLGDARYTPTEISAMILRALAAGAAAAGHPTTRAVITVPAWFSDDQRAATRRAGEMAGLTVERILNEPTAAALCYANPSQSRTTLVYDLGGGTFDVSVVRSDDGTTEVLASHGDTRLGGDDFDALIIDWLAARFQAQTGQDPRTDLRARVRLSHAAQAAKHRLSDADDAQIAEEHLLTVDGVPRHLDAVLTRAEYEHLIEPLLRRTLVSVQRAMDAAGLVADQLDEVVLVGGSTRTPRVAQMLTELLDMAPRLDVNPDEAVAMGAALHAARLQGQSDLPILVDITPHAFGVQCLGNIDGYETLDYFGVVVPAGSVLPTRRVRAFYTAQPGQRAIAVSVYQGEARYASDNHLVGEFRVEGLDEAADEHSPIDFGIGVDLDGILQIDVVERHTGLRKSVTLKGRLDVDTEVETGQARIAELMPTTDTLAAAQPPPGLTDKEEALWRDAHAGAARANRLRDGLEADDREELDELLDTLQAALQRGDMPAVDMSWGELADLLFYLE